jgi:uracil-DNA glycosylase
VPNILALSAVPTIWPCRTEYSPRMSLHLLARLPVGWRAALRPHLDRAAVADLGHFLEREYADNVVYPPLPDIFRALRLCSPESTRVLLLGQDPYHGSGQANGLCFSVPAGVAVPPSLRNIYAEMRDDLGLAPPNSGDLTRWAEQGVLLLNAVLTVRAGEPGSHAGRGWEQVSDAVIRVLNERPRRVVFVLWGGYARRKAALVTNPVHAVLESAHPSPMSWRGFRGTRPFSAVNAALVEAGQAPITWC